MQVYHNPQDDEKELRRLEATIRIKKWCLRKWEEIKSIWHGLRS